MRWSEDGFNHLLHLRLAWVNGRFEALFGLAQVPRTCNRARYNPVVFSLSNMQRESDGTEASRFTVKCS